MSEITDKLRQARIGMANIQNRAETMLHAIDGAMVEMRAFRKTLEQAETLVNQLEKELFDATEGMPEEGAEISE